LGGDLPRGIRQQLQLAHLSAVRKFLMTTQLRIPYFSMQCPGLFALGKTWQQFDRVDGCKPLDHPQARISMEKKPPLLPGEKALLAQQAAEKRKTDAEAAKQRIAAQKAQPQQSRSQAAKNRKGGVESRERSSQKQTARG
jgi:hypothetical protein